MKSYNGFSSKERAAAARWLKTTDKPPHPTSCCACLQTEGLLMWHSEDYSSPYGPHIGQFGLCYVCHMMIHCRFSAPEAWHRYCDLVAEGNQFGPLLKANFYAIEALCGWGLGAPLMRHVNKRRVVTVLDEIEEGHYLPPGRKNGTTAKHDD